MYSDSDSDDIDDTEQVQNSDELFYNVDGILIYKAELHNLIHSNSNEHKNKLNSLITKIITKSDRNALEYLILQGYRINIINGKGETAIHFAFRKSYDKMLVEDKGMLLFGCTDDQNYVDSRGLSLFHIACNLGNLPRVISYLKSGVDVNQTCNEIDYYSCCDKTGNLTPLHFAILNYRKNFINLLLKNGAHINIIDSEGRTTLHLASIVDEYRWPSSMEDDLEILKIFAKYPSMINAKDNHGDTPLLSIYYICHFETENLESEELSDDLQTTVMKSYMFDPRVRKLEKLEILLEHEADATLANNNGDTILHQIINDLEPSLRDPYHEPPLSFDDAVHAKAIQMVLTLGKKVDVNVKNKKGISPIQLAVSNMSSQIVKILLDHNADLNDLKFSYNRKKCFHYPSIVPTFECVQNLLGIVDLLLEKDFNLSLQDNMQVFKVLIHNDNFCCCYEIESEIKITRILSLSMPSHASYLCSDWLLQGVEKIEKFRFLLEYGKLFLDQEIREAVEEACSEFPGVTLDLSESELKKEITCMKSIQLTETKSLYDIMTMNPHNIHQYIANSDYQFLELFSNYKNIIKGHIAKSLTRHYIEKTAHEYLAELLGFSLHYPCYQTIMQYLSNEDIWAVCAAIFPESSYQELCRVVEEVSGTIVTEE